MRAHNCHSHAHSRPTMSAVAALVAACGLSAPSLAGDQAAAHTPRPLPLRSASIVATAANSVLAAGAFDGSRRYVLALDGPLSPQRTAALAAAGAVMEDYLGDGFILVKVAPGTKPPAVRATGFVTWASPYQDAWKLDPALSLPDRPAFATPERRAFEAAGQRVLIIHLFDAEPLQPALDAVRAIAGAAVLGVDRVGNADVITAAIPPGAIPGLSGLPAVRFVEECSEFTPRDTTQRALVQSGTPTGTPFYDRGITGQGEIIGLIDNRVDANHCAFLDPVNPIGPMHRKIVAYNTSAGADAHGTQVAGILAGDAGSADDNRGVAYNARFAYNIYPSATESSFVQRFGLHHAQGAFVHSNSWGDNNLTTYNGSCRGIDIFSWDNDDNLVIFAVTNGPLLRNPENAKNCLAVAAVGDSPNQDFFCSGGAGPTSDGRRKPEIVAPGCNILSASAGSACGLTANGGTSLATPAVSGAAVLLRQYFTLGYYPSGVANAPDAFVPSGPLLKAALINSAVDATGLAGFPGPIEGWGRVQADNAAYFAGDARKLIVRQTFNNTAGALTTGGSALVRVRVDSPAQPLKVTLAFHDYPGAVNSTAPVVNNLDLSVTDPASTLYRGNVFSGGVSTTGGSADAINNVEQVLLSAPSPGVYTVQISAPAVNTGQQGYAIVITGDVADLCPSDFNADGFVTGDDFDQFVQVFEQGDAAADFNLDGFVTGDDFDAFTAAFTAGC